VWPVKGVVFVSVFAHTFKDFIAHTDLFNRISDLSLEKYQGFWVQDCSAAVQNMLLAVHGLGLGAVWTGIYPMQDRVNGFIDLFNLPQNVIPLALVVIGHPAQEIKSETRYKADRVHFDTYGA